MDKKTRVLNALNHREVDHVPVGFWFHFAGEEAHGEPCVQAHLRYYRDADLDFIKIMCDGYFNYPITTAIEKAEDWFNLKPLGRSHPFITEQVERARRIVAEVQGECCVFYNVFAPFSSIRFGTSDELVMAHLRECPAAIGHALAVIAEDNALLAELLIREAGCDGIYYPVQGGEYDRLSYDEYREMIRPSDLVVLNRANAFSADNIIHLCGWAGVKNRVEVWRDYPAKAFNWAVYVEELPLKDGFGYFNTSAILGGFQSTKTGILYSGSESEIREFTRDLIQKTGKDGVILGGDCTVPADIDIKRIKWVVETARSL